MTRDQYVLLSILSKGLLFDNATFVEEDCDWEKMFTEAKEQAVSAVCFSALNRAQLSPELDSLWNKDFMRIISGNVRITYNHTLLHQWMTEANIPYVILKGVASSRYYPVPDYRTMGDVDFLVPEDQVDRAVHILQAHGLQFIGEEQGLHLTFWKKGMLFELHYEVSAIPKGEIGDLIHSYLKSIYEDASVHTLSTGDVILPSAFHHGLILLLHSSRHMFKSGIGLRHLCDWAVFVNSISDEEFRLLFEKKLKTIGLWRFAQCLTQACTQYLGIKDREWVVEKNYSLEDNRVKSSENKSVNSLAVELIGDIFASGNFGVKDTNRGLQSLLISRIGNNNLRGKDVFVQFIKSVNGVVYHHWPFARQCRAILPVGWIFFGARRVVRGFNGERKPLDIKNMIDGASERRQLYTDLHIFEKELYEIR